MGAVDTLSGTSPEATNVMASGSNSACVGIDPAGARRQRARIERLVNANAAVGIHRSLATIELHVDLLGPHHDHAACLIGIDTCPSVLRRRSAR